MQYIRDMFRLVGEELAYDELGSAVLEYAQLWMRFVLEKCDRGRGTRPRWGGRQCTIDVFQLIKTIIILLQLNQNIDVL